MGSPSPAVINFAHQAVSRPGGTTPDSWYPYTCGHCGRSASGAVLAEARTSESGTRTVVRWLQCPTCHLGSVWQWDDKVFPGVAFGPSIEGLPADVFAAYEEARRCMASNCYTAAEGMCRKILMHVAVEKGAKEGGSFVGYIDHLVQQGYVTPPMSGWVKLIKDHGNKSQHRVDPSTRERAEGTVLFTAQLLRAVYEMEHLANRFAPPATATQP